jgi:hypothetical protein
MGGGMSVVLVAVLVIVAGVALGLVAGMCRAAHDADRFWDYPPSGGKREGRP